MTTTETTTEPRPHPAKFSSQHLAQALVHLEREAARLGIPVEELAVLDSFAGVGTVHELPCNTWGVELEREWAEQHPMTSVGDATELSWPDRSFHAYFTSITFANRMADTYDGSRDRCTTAGCGKDGADEGWRLADDRDEIEDTEEVRHADLLVDETVVVTRCEDCRGTGRRPSNRMSYRIALGRMPSANSSAVMQWGTPWRRFHRLALAEAVRAVKDDGLLIVNASDSVRTVGSGDNRRVTYPPVVEFVAMTLFRLGCYVETIEPVGTRRYGHGANRERRAASEHLIVVRKGRPSLVSDLPEAAG